MVCNQFCAAVWRLNVFVCDFLSVSPSDAISDHFSDLADYKIPTDHSHTVPPTITYRKLKATNMEAFKADIKNSDLIKNPKSNATELSQQYDSSK